MIGNFLYLLNENYRILLFNLKCVSTAIDLPNPVAKTDNHSPKLSLYEKYNPIPSNVFG